MASRVESFGQEGAKSTRKRTNEAQSVSIFGARIGIEVGLDMAASYCL